MLRSENELNKPSFSKHRNVSLKGRVARRNNARRKEILRIVNQEYNSYISVSIAESLTREINETASYNEQTPEFVEEIRKKLFLLHDYNTHVAKIAYSYPFSKELYGLLGRYVALEYDVLYKNECNFKYEKQVEDRVFHTIISFLKESVSTEEDYLCDGRTHVHNEALKIFVSYVDVRYINDEEKFPARIVKNILDALGLIKKTSDNPTGNLDVNNPSLIRLKESLRDSDYGSDDDGHETASALSEPSFRTMLFKKKYEKVSKKEVSDDAEHKCRTSSDILHRKTPEIDTNVPCSSSDIVAYEETFTDNLSNETPQRIDDGCHLKPLHDESTPNFPTSNEVFSSISRGDIQSFIDLGEDDDIVAIQWNSYKSSFPKPRLGDNVSNKTMNTHTSDKKTGGYRIFDTISIVSSDEEEDFVYEPTDFDKINYRFEEQERKRTLLNNLGKMKQEEVSKVDICNKISNSSTCKNIVQSSTSPKEIIPSQNIAGGLNSELIIELDSSEDEDSVEKDKQNSLSLKGSNEVKAISTSQISEEFFENNCKTAVSPSIVGKVYCRSINEMLTESISDVPQRFFRQRRNANGYNSSSKPISIDLCSENDSDSNLKNVDSDIEIISDSEDINYESKKNVLSVSEREQEQKPSIENGQLPENVSFHNDVDEKYNKQDSRTEKSCISCKTQNGGALGTVSTVKNLLTSDVDITRQEKVLNISGSSLEYPINKHIENGKILSATDIECCQPTEEQSESIETTLLLEKGDELINNKELLYQETPQDIQESFTDHILSDEENEHLSSEIPDKQNKQLNIEKFKEASTSKSTENIEIIDNDQDINEETTKESSTSQKEHESEYNVKIVNRFEGLNNEKQKDDCEQSREEDIIVSSSQNGENETSNNQMTCSLNADIFALNLQHFSSEQNLHNLLNSENTTLKNLSVESAENVTCLVDEEIRIDYQKPMSTVDNEVLLLQQLCEDSQISTVAADSIDGENSNCNKYSEISDAQKHSSVVSTEETTLSSCSETSNGTKEETSSASKVEQTTSQIDMENSQSLICEEHDTVNSNFSQKDDSPADQKELVAPEKQSSSNDKHSETNEDLESNEKAVHSEVTECDAENFLGQSTFILSDLKDQNQNQDTIESSLNMNITESKQSIGSTTEENTSPNENEQVECDENRISLDCSQISTILQKDPEFSVEIGENQHINTTNSKRTADSALNIIESVPLSLDTVSKETANETNTKMGNLEDTVLEGDESSLCHVHVDSSKSPLQTDNCLLTILQKDIEFSVENDENQHIKITDSKGAADSASINVESVPHSLDTVSKKTANETNTKMGNLEDTVLEADEYSCCHVHVDSSELPLQTVDRLSTIQQKDTEFLVENDENGHINITDCKGAADSASNNVESVPLSLDTVSKKTANETDTKMGNFEDTVLEGDESSRCHVHVHSSELPLQTVDRLSTILQKDIEFSVENDENQHIKITDSKGAAYSASNNVESVPLSLDTVSEETVNETDTKMGNLEDTVLEGDESSLCHIHVDSSKSPLQTDDCLSTILHKDIEFSVENDENQHIKITNSKGTADSGSNTIESVPFNLDTVSKEKVNETNTKMDNLEDKVLEGDQSSLCHVHVDSSELSPQTDDSLSTILQKDIEFSVENDENQHTKITNSKGTADPGHVHVDSSKSPLQIDDRLASAHTEEVFSVPQDQIEGSPSNDEISNNPEIESSVDHSKATFSKYSAKIAPAHVVDMENDVEDSQTTKITVDWFEKSESNVLFDTPSAESNNSIEYTNEQSSLEKVMDDDDECTSFVIDEGEPPENIDGASLRNECASKLPIHEEVIFVASEYEISASDIAREIEISANSPTSKHVGKNENFKEFSQTQNIEQPSVEKVSVSSLIENVPYKFSSESSMKQNISDKNCDFGDSITKSLESTPKARPNRFSDSHNVVGNLGKVMSLVTNNEPRRLKRNISFTSPIKTSEPFFDRSPTTSSKSILENSTLYKSYPVNTETTSLVEPAPFIGITNLFPPSNFYSSYIPKDTRDNEVLYNIKECDPQKQQLDIDILASVASNRKPLEVKVPQEDDDIKLKTSSPKKRQSFKLLENKSKSPVQSTHPSSNSPRIEKISESSSKATSPRMSRSKKKTNKGCKGSLKSEKEPRSSSQKRTKSSKITKAHQKSEILNEEYETKKKTDKKSRLGKVQNSVEKKSLPEKSSTLLEKDSSSENELVIDCSDSDESLPLDIRMKKNDTSSSFSVDSRSHKDNKRINKSKGKCKKSEVKSRARASGLKKRKKGVEINKSIECKEEKKLDNDTRIDQELQEKKQIPLILSPVKEEQSRRIIHFKKAMLDSMKSSNLIDQEISVRSMLPEEINKGAISSFPVEDSVQVGATSWNSTPDAEKINKKNFDNKKPKDIFKPYSFPENNASEFNEEKTFIQSGGQQNMIENPTPAIFPCVTNQTETFLQNESDETLSDKSNKGVETSKEKRDSKSTDKLLQSEVTHTLNNVSELDKALPNEKTDVKFIPEKIHDKQHKTSQRKSNISRDNSSKNLKECLKSKETLTKEELDIKINDPERKSRTKRNDHKKLTSSDRNKSIKSTATRKRSDESLKTAAELKGCTKNKSKLLDETDVTKTSRKSKKHENLLLEIRKSDFSRVGKSTTAIDEVQASFSASTKQEREKPNKEKFVDKDVSSTKVVKKKSERKTKKLYDTKKDYSFNKSKTESNKSNLNETKDNEQKIIDSRTRNKSKDRKRDNEIARLVSKTECANDNKEKQDEKSRRTKRKRSKSRSSEVKFSSENEEPTIAKPKHEGIHLDKVTKSFIEDEDKRESLEKVDSDIELLDKKIDETTTLETKSSKFVVADVDHNIPTEKESHNSTNSSETEIVTVPILEDVKEMGGEIENGAEKNMDVDPSDSTKNIILSESEKDIVEACTEPSSELVCVDSDIANVNLEEEPKLNKEINSDKQFIESIDSNLATVTVSSNVEKVAESISAWESEHNLTSSEYIKDTTDQYQNIDSKSQKDSETERNLQNEYQNLNEEAHEDENLNLDASIECEKINTDEEHGLKSENNIIQVDIVADSNLMIEVKKSSEDNEETEHYEEVTVNGEKIKEIGIEESDQNVDIGKIDTEVNIELVETIKKNPDNKEIEDPPTDSEIISENFEHNLNNTVDIEDSREDSMEKIEDENFEHDAKNTVDIENNREDSKEKIEYENCENDAENTVDIENGREDSKEYIEDVEESTSAILEYKFQPAETFCSRDDTSSNYEKATRNEKHSSFQELAETQSYDHNEEPKATTETFYGKSEMEKTTDEQNSEDFQLVSDISEEVEVKNIEDVVLGESSIGEDESVATNEVPYVENQDSLQLVSYTTKPNQVTKQNIEHSEFEMEIIEPPEIIRNETRENLSLNHNLDSDPSTTKIQNEHQFEKVINDSFDNDMMLQHVGLELEVVSKSDDEIIKTSVNVEPSSDIDNGTSSTNHQVLKYVESTPEEKIVHSENPVEFDIDEKNTEEELENIQAPMEFMDIPDEDNVRALQNPDIGTEMETKSYEESTNSETGANDEIQCPELVEISVEQPNISTENENTIDDEKLSSECSRVDIVDQKPYEDIKNAPTKTDDLDSEQEIFSSKEFAEEKQIKERDINSVQNVLESPQSTTNKDIEKEEFMVKSDVNKKLGSLEDRSDESGIKDAKTELVTTTQNLNLILDDTSLKMDPESWNEQKIADSECDTPAVAIVEYEIQVSEVVLSDEYEELELVSSKKEEQTSIHKIVTEQFDLDESETKSDIESTRNEIKETSTVRDNPNHQFIPGEFEKFDFEAGEISPSNKRKRTVEVEMEECNAIKKTNIQNRTEGENDGRNKSVNILVESSTEEIVPSVNIDDEVFLKAAADLCTHNVPKQIDDPSKFIKIHQNTVVKPAVSNGSVYLLPQKIESKDNGSITVFDKISVENNEFKSPKTDINVVPNETETSDGSHASTSREYSMDEAKDMGNTNFSVDGNHESTSEKIVHEVPKLEDDPKVANVPRNVLSFSIERMLKPTLKEQSQENMPSTVGFSEHAVSSTSNAENSDIMKPPKKLNKKYGKNKRKKKNRETYKGVNNKSTAETKKDLKVIVERVYSMDELALKTSITPCLNLCSAPILPVSTELIPYRYGVYGTVTPYRENSCFQPNIVTERDIDISSSQTEIFNGFSRTETEDRVEIEHFGPSDVDVTNSNLNSENDIEIVQMECEKYQDVDESEGKNVENSPRNLIEVDKNEESLRTDRNDEIELEKVDVSSLNTEIVEVEQLSVHTAEIDETVDTSDDMVESSFEGIKEKEESKGDEANLSPEVNPIGPLHQFQNIDVGLSTPLSYPNDPNENDAFCSNSIECSTNSDICNPNTVLDMEHQTNIIEQSSETKQTTITSCETENVDFEQVKIQNIEVVQENSQNTNSDLNQVETSKEFFPESNVSALLKGDLEHQNLSDSFINKVMNESSGSDGMDNLINSLQSAISDNMSQNNSFSLFSNNSGGNIAFSEGHQASSERVDFEKKGEMESQSETLMNHRFNLAQSTPMRTQEPQQSHESLFNISDIFDFNFPGVNQGGSDVAYSNSYVNTSESQNFQMIFENPEFLNLFYNYDDVGCEVTVDNTNVEDIIANSSIPSELIQEQLIDSMPPYITEEEFDSNASTDPMVGGQKEHAPDHKQDSNLDEAPFPESALSFDEEVIHGVYASLLHCDVNSAVQTPTCDPSIQVEESQRIANFELHHEEKRIDNVNNENFGITDDKTKTETVVSSPQTISKVGSETEDYLKDSSNCSSSANTIEHVEEPLPSNKKENSLTDNTSSVISTDAQKKDKKTASKTPGKVQKIPASKYAPPKKLKNNETPQTKKTQEKEVKQSKISETIEEGEPLILNIGSNHSLDMPQLLSPTENTSLKSKSLPLTNSGKDVAKEIKSEEPQPKKRRTSEYPPVDDSMMQFDMYHRTKVMKRNAAKIDNYYKFYDDDSSSTNKNKKRKVVPKPNKPVEDHQPMVKDSLHEYSSKKESVNDNESKKKKPKVNEPVPKVTKDSTTHRNETQVNNHQPMVKDSLHEYSSKKEFVNDNESKKKKPKVNEPIPKVTKDSTIHRNETQVNDHQPMVKDSLHEYSSKKEFVNDNESKKKKPKVNEPIPKVTKDSTTHRNETQVNDPYALDLDDEFDKLKRSGPFKSGVSKMNRNPRIDRILRSAQESSSSYYQVPSTSSQHRYSDRRLDDRGYADNYRRPEDSRRKSRVQERSRSPHSRSRGHPIASGDYRRDSSKRISQQEAGRNDYPYSRDMQSTSDDRRRISLEGYHSRDPYKKIDRPLKKSSPKYQPPQHQTPQPLFNRPYPNQSKQKTYDDQGNEWYAKLDEWFPLEKEVYYNKGH